MASTPKTLLSTCSNCGRHVFVDERVCPFCRAARALRTAGISAALLASACGGSSTTTRIEDSGKPDAVADAAAQDSMTNDVTWIDTGAPDASDASADADPCVSGQCTPNCPCPLYRSPPPRLG